MSCSHVPHYTTLTQWIPTGYLWNPLYKHLANESYSNTKPFTKNQLLYKKINQMSKNTDQASAFFTNPQIDMDLPDLL